MARRETKIGMWHAVRTLVLSAVTLLPYGSVAQSGDVFAPFLHDPARPNVLRLAGDIDLRTPVRFGNALNRYPEIDTLELASAGGSAYGALLMVDRIHDAGLKTVIPAGAVCQSACSFLFLAGAFRTAEGALGVHQPSGSNLATGLVAVNDVLDMFDRFDVPAEVRRRMLDTPPDGMYFFSPEELDRLGLVGPARGQGAPQAPGDTVPGAGSVAAQAVEPEIRATLDADPSDAPSEAPSKDLPAGVTQTDRPADGAAGGAAEPSFPDRDAGVAAPVEPAPGGRAEETGGVSPDGSPAAASAQPETLRDLAARHMQVLASEGGAADDWARALIGLAQLGETDRAAVIWGEARVRFAGFPDAIALIDHAAAKAGLRAPAPFAASPADDGQVVLTVKADGSGDYAVVADAVRDAREGARIAIYPGVYAGGFSVARPVDIVGIGPRAGIVLEIVGGRPLRWEAEGGSVSGLTIRAGATADTGSAGSLVEIRRGAPILSDNDISATRGAEYPAIAVLDTAQAPRILGNTIHDAGLGILMSGAAGGIVEANTFADVNVGVRVTAGDPTVQGNSFRGVDYGIQVEGAGGGTLRENRFAGCTWGIGLGRGVDPLLEDNAYSSCWGTVRLE